MARIIGITGGIGSGKTTFCRELGARGFAVYESDTKAHYLLNNDADVRLALLQLLGEQVYVNGSLDRKAVAKLVFSDKSLLQKMNEIVHPAVKRDFQLWAEQYTTQSYIFIESAILFESGFDEMCDATVLVDAPLELRITRTMQRDNATREQVEGRMRNQKSAEELKRLSDYCVLLDGKNALPDLVNNILSKLSEAYEFDD